MSKVTIKDFSGQINTDIYTPSTVDFRYSENFDLSARTDVLLPFRGTVGMTATSGPNSFFLSDFIYGTFGTGISENVLAYGVQSGQAIGGRPELYKISDTLPGTTWATALTSTGTSADSRYLAGCVFNNLFHLHKGIIYLASGNAYIEKIGNIESAGQGATWTTRYSNFSWVAMTNAITHSKDGLMYYAYTDATTSISAPYIGVITNSTTINNTAFPLPIGTTPTSVAEYGDLLAVSLKNNVTGNSTVVLWNRDTSQTTLTEVIDWGQGSLNVLDNIDGHLIGISLVYNASFNLSPRIVVKEWSGGTVNIIDTIYISTAFAPILSTKKYKQNGQLYFGLKASINGTRHALFRVGKNKSGRFVVTGDVSINNNVSVSTLEGFAKVGDIWYLGFDAGSVNRSVTTGYPSRGEWNSLVNPNMPIADRNKLKQLISIQADYEAIPSGGSVVIQYGVDGGSYTTVITDSTANSTTSGVISLDASGTQFTAGRDYEFIIKSTGVTIKRLTYVYESLDTN